MALYPLNSREGEDCKTSLWNCVSSFFFPDLCAACKAPGYRNLCPSCQRVMEEAFMPKTFLCTGGNGYADAMMALFPYNCVPVKKIILTWKQKCYDEFSAVAGHYVERAVKQRGFFKGIDRVTFLPRQASTRYLVGFDQAEQLAETVARVLNLPLETLLYRKGHRPPQHKISSDRRISNVSGVFFPTCRLNGETVLLVDDVITSGAGARECARVLKKAGAQKVYVLALARPYRK